MLRAAWAAVGGVPRELERLVVTAGRPGWLPSTLPVLEAMIAAVSCSTLAASVLDAARGGEPDLPVSIDARHVALAARSERHARAEGAPPVDLFAPLSRFWPARDGWIRLHANYPWHRDRALAVLGCDAEAVGAAIAERGAEEIEQALADAGGLGAAVRTPEAWAAHSQGRAVAALPLVITGPAGLRSSSVPGRPGRFAEGLRVLDLTRVIAGPVATRTLAAWGADVLRLDLLPEIPAQALDTLPGKRSARLDLAADRPRLERLLGEADIIVQGYRPGALRASAWTPASWPNVIPT